MQRPAKTVFDRLDRPPTFQEVKDHITAFFEKQGALGVSVTGRCLYLSSEGNKCAVGCFLDDQPAALEWNGLNDSALPSIVERAERGELRYTPPVWMVSGDMLSYLVLAQRYHDASATDGSQTEEKRTKEFLERFANLPLPTPSSPEEKTT